MKKILIVEDEGLIANNLAYSLRKNGYDACGIAASGEDALVQVNLLKPDLMLMDIHLSGTLDGIETAEKIRAEFAVPVIFLTAHATGVFLDRAKRTYPFGYLVKPVRQVDLVSAVEIALYKHDMEQKLKQREAWLATTLRCAGDGVVVTDSSGRIEFLNDISKRILCLHDRDVIGQYFCDVVRLQKKCSGVLVGDLVQLAILQGTTINIGSDVILTDESRQEADLEGEVALSKIDGSIVGTVFTFRDVTIRNSQEEHRRQYLGTQACARLATAVSAELKTLLQPPDPGASDSSEPIGTRSLASLSRMVEQLDVVKRNNASYPAAIDLNALIANVCSQLRPDISANVELAFQLQPDLDRIYADPAQIEQMIGSLIRRSQEFLQTGGTIHVATRSYSFERRGFTGQKESYVALTIDDTSRGIAAAEADRLVEPFSGGDAPADEWDLRLFLVHRIVSNARGSIRAHMKPNQGASLEIILPSMVAQEDVISSTGLDEGAEGPAILLLQADDDVRSLISDSLEQDGYMALGARDYSEAVEWMTIHPGSIALLVTGMDLSQVRSPELIAQLSGRRAETRVIFTGDHAMVPAVMNVWMEHGACFLNKPFQLEELLVVIREMLAENRPGGPQIQRTAPGPLDTTPEPAHSEAA
jgi:two-component system cell cycle sensor histidine kinase/response regulator CckA